MPAHARHLEAGPGDAGLDAGWSRAPSLPDPGRRGAPAPAAEALSPLGLAQMREAATFEHHPMALLAVDAQGCILRASRQALRLLQWPASVLIGAPLSRLMPHLPWPDGQAGPLLAQLAGGAAHETWWLGGRGERLDIALTVVPVPLDQGQPGYHLFATDISPLRRQQRQLRLQAQVIEQAQDAVVIVDAASRVLSWNRGASRLYGTEAGQAIGRELTRVLPVQDPAALSQALWRVATGALAAQDLELTLADGAGSSRQVVLTMRHLGAGGPDGAGVVLYGRDLGAHRGDEVEGAQATHDPVTGLPHRGRLSERLREAVDRARGGACAVGLLVVDLDGFRTVNDTLGHDAGDELLGLVAARLGEATRVGDTVCRLGSDEFAVVLPDLQDGVDLAPLAAQLLQRMAQPYALQGRTVHLTCSVGAALWTAARQDESADDPGQWLVQRASLAMHAARRAGRNGFHVFDGAHDARAVQELALRAELPQALASNQLVLHFQPQFDLRTGRLCGLEALVRWRHPRHGLLPPSRFIALAEETGQIVALGSWVLEQACRTNQSWIARGLLDVPVAVNVSGVQLQRADFVEHVRALLQRTGLPPGRLELELTESVLLDDGGAVRDCLHQLRDMGVGLALDDFGTGFSSLSYLRRFPLHKVKIDRSFIQDLTHDGDDASLTLSIIAIAHHLRLRVVAEGVETAAQLRYLRRHLCDEIQGHAMAQPMDEAALEAYLADPARPQLELAAADDDRPTVLLVDDEPNVLRALARTLRREGYRLLQAQGAQQAFELLAIHEVDVILSDQRMPDMSGTAFLGQVKSLYPATMRIVLSGYTDLQTVTEAINRGAIYRFLTKPWDDAQLRGHVREAVLQARRQPRAPSPGD